MRSQALGAVLISLLLISCSGSSGPNADDIARRMQGFFKASDITDINCKSDDDDVYHCKFKVKGDPVRNPIKFKQDPHGEWKDPRLL